MMVSLSPSDCLSLFAALFALAMVPSLSVVTVCARSATFGLSHGVLAALGIVAGDILFILVAVLGLATVVGSVNGLAHILKYAGGAYLVWLGVQSWRSRNTLRQAERGAGASRSASFAAGFLLTLSDQKAILFYLVFFPAFVDLSALTPADTALIAGIAALSVGGAKILYAVSADRLRLLPGAGLHRATSILAAAVLVAAGVLLVLKY